MRPYIKCLPWSGLGGGALALAGCLRRRYANSTLCPATPIGVGERVYQPVVGGIDMRHALARPEQSQSPSPETSCRLPHGIELLGQQRAHLLRALASGRSISKNIPCRFAATGQGAGTGYAPAERIETLESCARHGRAALEPGRLPDRDVPRTRLAQRVAMHRHRGATPPRFKSGGTSNRTAWRGAWSTKLI